jgi:hypothetical protein
MGTILFLLLVSSEFVVVPIVAEIFEGVYVCFCVCFGGDVVHSCLHSIVPFYGIGMFSEVFIHFQNPDVLAEI